MGTRVADRLGEARQRAFVGRRPELEAFTELLGQPELPCAVLFVWGPGGVGKTTLLRRWADVAAAAGVPCLLLDARNVPPQAEALTHALSPAFEDTGERAVVLLDTWELLTGLDGLLRDELLPRLPADTLVVLASQHPPAAAWRTDPGWSALVRLLPLRNLSPDESSEYLRSRGVPAALHADALMFTHGHPLALALVGEVMRHQGAFAADGSPDVLAALLERLLRHVPTRAHAEALEAAAQVRVLTEPLLDALLPDEDARTLFGWLRGLPVVDVTSSGLFPHDLAREVLAADLRWRDPLRYRLVHDRARAYYLARLAEADAGTQARVLMDLMYLHRDLRSFLRPPDREASAAGLRVDAMRTGDVDAVCAMVARHEGPGSAAVARYWCERQPTAWLVVRDADGQPAGAMCLLAVDGATAEDADNDPAVASCLRQLATMPPLRPGDRVTHVRFWLARETYQAVSPVQSLIATELARHFLTTSGLAVTLLPFASPDDWADFCAYADQHRMQGADFEVDGVRYAVHGHDWRAVPPAAWVTLLSQRELAEAPVQVPVQHGPQVLVVLSEPEFAQAVRAVLRDLTRPDRLRDSPLLRSRLVTSRVPDDARAGDRVKALQDAVRDSAARLQRSPTDARGYRALHRAYLSPASTLERAAEALGLPSSTFRRHLSQGVSRLTALLWESELGTW